MPRDASGCLVFDLIPRGACVGRAYGPTTLPVTVSNDLGLYPLRFFVEFRPGGFHAFTPIPQWELADQILPLPCLDPSLDKQIGAIWEQAGDLDTFIASVDGLLLARCSPAPGLDRLIRTFAHTSSPVSSLAEETGYSARHLSRLLRNHAGVGPKALLQVFRMNEAVRRIQAEPCSLTRLAQELGYFDQSHFSHAFRAVCGVPPSTYQANLSDFYNEPFKF